MFKRITPKELRIQKRVEREKTIVNPGVVEIVARRKSIFSRKLERTQKRERGESRGLVVVQVAVEWPRCGKMRAKVHRATK